jgi:hypothetical protein
MMRRLASVGSRSRDGLARGGWQLVELMITIGLTSMVLAVAGKFLAVLLSAEHRYGLALQDAAVHSRLAEQFRDDAHLSIRGQLEGQTLDLEFADGRAVRYRAERSVMHREEANPGVKLIKRDVYRQSEGEFGFEQDQPARLVCIVHETNRAESETPRESARDVRIEAALGLIGPSTPESHEPVAEARSP